MARLPAWTPDLAALTARWRARLALSGPRADRRALDAVAYGKALKVQLRAEWAGSPPHLWLIAGPRPEGLAAAPTEPRPPRARRGKAIASGRFVFDGLVLETGPGGDPWNRPSPSHAFAEALHGMDWLPDLLAQDGGARPALALVLGWLQVFGRWNAFAWSPPVLERRGHYLACALKPLLAEAGPAGAPMLDALARQARHLLFAGGDETRRAERAAAAALAGAVLGGRAGEQLLSRGLARLEHALLEAVLPDGGHASRAPEAALELLFDLKVLDQALDLRGRPAPAELARAIDRLTSAVRRLTLADGRLAALQGGEESDPARIAAAVGEAAQASSVQEPAPRRLRAPVRRPACWRWSTPAPGPRRLERLGLRPALGDRGDRGRRPPDRLERLVAEGLRRPGPAPDAGRLHRQRLGPQLRCAPAGLAGEGAGLPPPGGLPGRRRSPPRRRRRVLAGTVARRLGRGLRPAARAPPLSRTRRRRAARRGPAGSGGRRRPPAAEAPPGPGRALPAASGGQGVGGARPPERAAAAALGQGRRRLVAAQRRDRRQPGAGRAPGGRPPAPDLAGGAARPAPPGRERPHPLEAGPRRPAAHRGGNPDAARGQAGARKPAAKRGAE